MVSIVKLYATKDDGQIRSLECTDDGALKVDTEISANIDLSMKVLSSMSIDFSSASAQTIIAAPGSGKRIRICHFELTSGATPATNFEVALKSGSTVIKTLRAAAITLDYTNPLNLDTNSAFVLQTTTADRVVGGVDYYVEDA